MFCLSWTPNRASSSSGLHTSQPPFLSPAPHTNRGTARSRFEIVKGPSSDDPTSFLTFPEKLLKYTIFSSVHSTELLPFPRTTFSQSLIPPFFCHFLVMMLPDQHLISINRVLLEIRRTLILIFQLVPSMKVPSAGARLRGSGHCKTQSLPLYPSLHILHPGSNPHLTSLPRSSPLATTKFSPANSEKHFAL